MLEYLLWAVIVAGVFSFILAWALGANDVANAFGTSVGSKVLTHRQAVLIASVVEFAGAFLMGSHVVETMRKGIIKPELYVDDPADLLLGMFSVLIAGALWLVIATFLGLPVSTTHSIVGAIIGFTFVAQGPNGINWWDIGKIVISWVSSPCLAGAASFTMFFLVRFFILRRTNSLQLGFRFLPFFYGVTLGVLAFFVIYKGSPGLGLSDLPLWLIITICVSVALGGLFLTWFIGVPLMWRYINRKFSDSGERRTKTEIDESRELDEGFGRHLMSCCMSIPFVRHWMAQRIMEQGNETLKPERDRKYGSIDKTSSAESDVDHITEKDSLKDPEQGTDEVDDHLDKQQDPTIHTPLPSSPSSSSSSTSPSSSAAEEDMYAHSEVFDPRTEELFSMLQVLTACVGGFAHGANDVANSIAPFAVIIAIYVNDDVEQNTDVPWWILLMGGAGIVLGLIMWGHRVMKTIGTKMTKLTPSRGFNIEFGAALTVLVASRLQIPVSTTHCVVGSVFFVGLADGHKAVNWKLILSIFGSWVITLPFTSLLTAAIFALLELVV
jgi:sodium-dependent phosphate transporter